MADCFANQKKLVATAQISTAKLNAATAISNAAAAAVVVANTNLASSTIAATNARASFEDADASYNRIIARVESRRAAEIIADAREAADKKIRRAQALDAHNAQLADLARQHDEATSVIVVAKRDAAIASTRAADAKEHASVIKIEADDAQQAALLAIEVSERARAEALVQSIDRTRLRHLHRQALRLRRTRQRER